MKDHILGIIIVLGLVLFFMGCLHTCMNITPESMALWGQ